MLATNAPEIKLIKNYLPDDDSEESELLSPLCPPLYPFPQLLPRPPKVKAIGTWFDSCLTDFGAAF